MVIVSLPPRGSQSPYTAPSVLSSLYAGPAASMLLTAARALRGLCRFQDLANARVGELLSLQLAAILASRGA